MHNNTKTTRRRLPPPLSHIITQYSASLDDFLIRINILPSPGCGNGGSKASKVTTKLENHHRSIPIRFEVFLAELFYFQSIKLFGYFTGRTARTELTCYPILKAIAPPPYLALKTDPPPHPPAFLTEIPPILPLLTLRFSLL
ncbi:hypothetical protein AVEN_98275-1 [Araneus ventricosus]|uniref:Uncharacterized protein n=1 Tax=Araneus ventricosus TaxID=182803 RepID=A0A4Y2IEN2_ARAVE|nr:hypothetical protein AVEN_98275-1 [Araneus ventricosus]